jgi:hypothetical protein
MYAWKIADAMLHEKKDLESCYFAAQTMRTKVQLNFNELPKESHDSLRDSLMDHISQVSEQTNIVIVTQVSVYSVCANLKNSRPSEILKLSFIFLILFFLCSCVWPWQI